MRVLVTGDAGYVGSALVPRLLLAGHNVNTLDIINQCLNGPFPIASFNLHGRPDSLVINQGDMRDEVHIRRAISGCHAVIHLACLSNDPTSDLDPALTKSINYDSFRPLVKAAKDAGVKRFIFASSSAVYGVKNELNVTEDLLLEPITDYARYKAMCEEVLLEEKEPGFEVVIVRPATVCGYAPALRLDLCVHILTMAALRFKEIKVFGGNQYRPNIHIDDICNAYMMLVEAPADKVDGQVFNCGTQNMTIMQTAELIAQCIPTAITATESTDPRSYHVSSGKIKRVLGFEPQSTVSDAIMELKDAWYSGKILDPDNDRYYRVRSIKKMGLK